MQAEAPAAPSVRLVASGLAKDYGARRVLQVDRLDIPAGTIVAVVGPNGSGKSTLLGRLAGVIRGPGEVTLDGRRIAPDRLGRVAYLPQRVRLPASATVGESLALFAAIRAAGPDRVRLPEGFLAAQEQLIGSLSGGQARRVALAAVLAGSPDLLLLDEPFANLDDDARRVTGEILAFHRDAGAVAIVASPTAVELLALSDGVLEIEGGRVGDPRPARAYLASLEVSIWVALDGSSDPETDALARLPQAVRARREGAWVVIDCFESHSVALLRALEGMGIGAERIRLGGTVAEPRPPAGADR